MADNLGNEVCQTGHLRRRYRFFAVSRRSLEKTPDAFFNAALAAAFAHGQDSSP